MSGPPLIDDFGPIAERYDALLCDAWGVIHNGVDLLPGAREALLRFRRERGPVVIITNAPRPSSIIPAQLRRLGLPDEAYDDVVTAGDAARAEIEARLAQPAFRIGPAKDDALFEGLEVVFAPLEEAGFVICTGLVDDHREEPDEYRPLLEKCVARGLDMVCANPDVAVNWGGRMIWCAGALAQIYETLGGRVIYGGKPHAAIYRLSLAACEKAKGALVAAALAVGDGLDTDIRGANEHGVDALLIAGEGGLLEGGAGAEAALRDELASRRLRAVAIARSLRWSPGS